MEEYYDTFNKLGYQTNKKGAEYFFDLLDEIRILLRDGESDEEILRVIPSICLEEYHFRIEVGGNLYKERIKDFLTDKKESEDKDLLQEVSGISKDLSIEEAALLFAKYFDAKELERTAQEEENIGAVHR